MKILKPDLNLEQYYQQLSNSPRRLLMLDYDGTLAPFTTDRKAAVPYPDIVTTLKQLFENSSTRVVIISGRAIDSLKELISFARPPELWGCHGLERRTASGDYSIQELPEEMKKKLSELYSWTAEVKLVNFCEFKPSGAAFHWRGLPDEEVDYIKTQVTEKWRDVAETSDLELYDFDGGVEIRVVGTDKAIPVRSLLSESNDDTQIAYLGDDLTDEDAFKALSGRGLSVLVRKELRETSADLWITPPEELRDFLARWL